MPTQTLWRWLCYILLCFPRQLHPTDGSCYHPCRLLQSWQFMRRRIEVEDRLLRRFFGAEWEEWRLAVPSGLPWIP